MTHQIAQFARGPIGTFLDIWVFHVLQCDKAVKGADGTPSKYLYSGAEDGHCRHRAFARCRCRFCAPVIRSNESNPASFEAKAVESLESRGSDIAPLIHKLAIRHHEQRRKYMR